MIMEKDRIIDTKELQIYRNTFIYDDSVVQLENISRISISPVAKRSIPSWAILCAIAGALILFAQWLIGIALLGIGGGYIAYIINQNSKAGHYLAIELNSGTMLYFTGKNEAFLNKIMRTMGDCMNNKTQGYVINMGQATITNMQVGNENTIL